jgi:phosphohistidine phosphatase SixA
MKVEDPACHGAKTRPTWQRIPILTPAGVLLSFICTVLCTVLFFQFSSPSVPEFKPGSPEKTRALASSWAKGEWIVLIRHEERCDRSTSPCPDVPDGITVNGKNLAVATGNAFESLGIQRTDFFTSPVARTKQTANYMFKTAVTAQEWLGNCKTITIDEIARHKAEERNLVLVTHSQCIEKLEKDMKVAAFREANYGALMFVSLDKKTRTPISAEIIEAAQFIADFTKSK